jgi:hypothetical protein
MIVEIPLTDEFPHYSFRIDLESVAYVIDVRLNVRANRWTMDIYDVYRNPLRLGQRLLTGYPLFRGAAGCVSGFPPGKFFLLDVTGKEREMVEVGLGTDFKLFYEEAS